jgi:hypothetical protein
MKIRIIFCLTIFILSLNLSFGQIKDVRVDERVELLSIIFNIAGAEEYNNLSLESYQNDINLYFKKYKNHELIKQTKKLIKQYDVGYDRVIEYALYTEIENNKLTFLKDVQDSKIDSILNVPEGVSKTYLGLLNDFYKTTNFNLFFKQHDRLYSTAIQNFDTILNNIDTKWFNDFFSTNTNEDYNVILFFCNYGHNYGPKINVSDVYDKIYSVIGVWDIDSLLMPIYPKENTDILIHEFAHSFCNPIIDSLYENIANIANEFYKIEEPIMKEYAYSNPKIILYENLVRATVIMYLKSYNCSENDIINNLLFETKKGFWLVKYFYELLLLYEKNRDNYQSFNTFLPKIEEYINNISISDFKENSVKIKHASIKNNSKKIDANISEFTIYFNKPMNAKTYGIAFNNIEQDLQNYRKPQWNSDCTSLTFYSYIFKPRKKYLISFSATDFIGANGEPMLESYNLYFETK